MSRQVFLFCLLIVSFVVFGAAYFLCSLRLEDGQLVAVMGSNSKLLLHTAVTNSFLMGPNAIPETLAWDHPPHSPFLPSEGLYASFLPDFYIAACVHAGMTVNVSFKCLSLWSLILCSFRMEHFVCPMVSFCGTCCFLYRTLVFLVSPNGSYKWP